MPLFRKERESTPVAPGASSSKRAHPGLLRRERRALLTAREERLRDLGGLTVEMYRRGAWRDDLLHERCAEVIGIDARLAEIDELLHGSEGTDRCTCGAPVLRSSHFCPNCGRLLDGSEDTGTRIMVSGDTSLSGELPALDDTVIAPPNFDDDE